MRPCSLCLETEQVWKGGRVELNVQRLSVGGKQEMVLLGDNNDAS